jgi:hypothetical protein
MARLDLNKRAILDDEEQEQVKSATQILEEVKEHVEELGLPEYPRPRTQPEPIDHYDIEAMLNPQLGQLFARYTAFAQFVFGQLAQAESGYKLAVSALKLREAKMKAKLYAQNVPNAQVSAHVKDDPLFIEAELEVLKLFATKTILEAHYKAYDKQAAALSRIIALRELEFEKEARENGIMTRRGRSKGQAPQRPARDFSKKQDDDE